MNSCKYLSEADARKLVEILRANAPLDTGALRNHTIYAGSFENGFSVIVGSPGGIGREPHKYAWFTEHKNKSSLGWIKKSCQIWANEMQIKYNALKFKDVDEEEEM